VLARWKELRFVALAFVCEFGGERRGRGLEKKGKSKWKK